MAAPFFIVGNDRSGTTLLRLMLDAGPEAAIPPESMFLTDFELEPPPDAAAAAALLEEIWSHPKVRLWELPDPPPPIPAGLSASEHLRFVLEAPFRAYAAQHAKPRWGDKTPHYVHHVDRLLRVWPQARFVVLVRDGRDVALSVKPLPFGPNNAWAAAQWWARGIRAGAAAEERHPDQVLTVRYEDLATDARAVLPRICAFLGLRQTDDMLSIENFDRSKIVADQADWFPMLFEGISDRSVARWQREMSVRDQRLFAHLAGDELEQLGYPVERNGHVEISRLQERWFHHSNQFLRNYNFLKLRLVQERGREFRHALRRRLRSG